MLKSKYEEEHSLKHSMIRSYVIGTCDHVSILLTGNRKSKFRVIESSLLQTKILLLFQVEQKQYGERKFW